MIATSNLEQIRVSRGAVANDAPELAMTPGLSSDGAVPEDVPAAPRKPLNLRPLLPLAVVVLLLIKLGICWVALPASLAGLVDFKAFYTAGHLLLHGHGHEMFSYAFVQAAERNLFGADSNMLPFLYPPYAALFFAPFALLSYRTAFLVFGALNLLCLAAAALLLSREVAALARMSRALKFGLMAVIFPVSIVLVQGQISILLLLLYVGFERLLTRRMHLLAGLLLSLGLVKFQIALPVALLFLAWRFYRVFAGFVCGSVALGLISVAVCGRQGLMEYLHITTQMTGSTLLHPAAAKLQYGLFPGDMPNLYGLLLTLAHGRLLGAALVIVSSFAVMAWAWGQRPSIAVALPAAMLVSYHMQAYDLVLLLLPLLLELGWLMDGPENAVAVPTGTSSWHEISPRRRTLAKVLLIVAVILLTAPVSPLLLVTGFGSVMALAIVCVLGAGRAL